MDPLAHMYLALMSSKLKPTFAPTISADFLSVLVILVTLIADHLFFLYTVAKVVWSPAPCCRRYATQRQKDTTIHTLV